MMAMTIATVFERIARNPLPSALATPSPAPARFTDGAACFVRELDDTLLLESRAALRWLALLFALVLLRDAVLVRFEDEEAFDDRDVGFEVRLGVPDDRVAEPLDPVLAVVRLRYVLSSDVIGLLLPASLSVSYMR